MTAKIYGAREFDIPMGAFDGAEISDLAGLYMLHKLINIEKVFNIDEAGLYRDDGLSALSGNGQEMT